MMKCFAVCMVAFVTLCPWAYAYLGDKMAETIQQCCSEGDKFARTHAENDCLGNLPASPDVPHAFLSMCTMAKTTCCKEYFQKKNDCDSGIDISISSNSCDSTKGTSKSCCQDCARGTSLGAFKGPGACLKSSQGFLPDEILLHDAFMKCCEKAAKDWKDTSSHRSSNAITSSVLPSTCEDYAPNELCAHYCIAVPGSYKCECKPGFMLMADGRNCKEVTRNRCKPWNHCQHKCNDNGVDVKCSCRRGYELMPDGKSCQDIDECQLDVSVCLPNTKCHNIQGSYRCLPKKANGETGQCPPGFTRNVENNACDDINECLLPNPPCPSFICENTMGGYLCRGVSGDSGHSNHEPPLAEEDRCPPGFKIGVHEECEDVDECETQKHDCNLLSQFCINTHSSFYCQDKASRHCPPGFKIDVMTNKCEDINECEDDENLCRSDQICVNQRGRYDCKPKEDHIRNPSACPSGMRKKDGSLFCEDIDECAENPDVCDLNQNCLNTIGSYDCHCQLGYELDVTTSACVDVNECATGQHDCMPQAQRCDNTVGSFLCVRIASCGTGYVLQHSTGKCEDIDECALGIHNCGSEYSCLNIRGSFRCARRRTTTTSTTPDPDYEYWYDYEDKPGNETSSSGNESPKEPATTTTSTTPKPEPPTTKPTTQPSPPPTPEPDRSPEENNVEPPSTDIHYSEPKNTELPEPTPTLLVIPKPPESSPKPKTSPQPPVTESQTFPTVVLPPSTEPVYLLPDLKATDWSPFKPSVPSQEPVIPPEIPEDELPKEPEQYSTPHYFRPETDNESIPPEPEKHLETTYIPLPLPTERPSPPAPAVVVPPAPAVVVSVGRETTTVPVVEPEVPKQIWPEIHPKPKECPFGFEPDEYGSCFDIDECATNRHSCSGLTETCRNTIGGYTCNCAPGFRRDLVTKSCDVITTSSSTTSTTTPAPPPSSSTSKSFWGYPNYRVTPRPFWARSQCDAGFHYNFKTSKCEDINECKNGQANCAAVEICVNTLGGYKCECPPNWRLDDLRHRCVPDKQYGQVPPGYENQPVYPTLPPKIHVPSSSGTKYVDPEITQIEHRGSIFKCPAGYRLGDDNTCIDINECLTGEAKCGPLQLCSNLPGGYSCNCPSGHRLIGDHECEDVDECAIASNVCSQNADCMNTIGSYQCKCHTGFTSAPVNDKVCVDVDECMASRPGTLCQHRCNNVWGGYRCSCHRGYRLKPDNSTCADIDECIEFKSKIPCVGRCLNEPGSYRCDCPKGYKLSEDKRSCIDIDECETGEALCATSISSTTANDVCVNTRGSFRCHRITCPIGYRLENKHRCTKEQRVCPPGDWNCSRQPTTISYNFITFVSNLYIPNAELKLFTMKGPAWSNAKMRFELRLVNVNAPPSVKRKADINDFLLTQKTNFEGLMSLVRPLEGPQSIELEMSMDVYTDEQFGGTAVAKIFIYVSEFEF